MSIPTAGLAAKVSHRLVAIAATVGGLAALGVYGIGQSFAYAVATGVLVGLMVAIALIDLSSFRIPDNLSLPAIPLGILANGSLVDPNADALVPIDNLMGAGAAAAGLYLFGAAYQALRGRAGIGLGDVKLLAAVAAWVGPWRVPAVLLFASLAGLGLALSQRLVLGDSGALDAARRLPFGTFLALSLTLVWMAGAIAPAISSS